MSKIPVAPVGGERGDVVFGMFAGDDADSQFINLGFAPKAVLVVADTGEMANSNYYYGGLALPGYPCHRSSGPLIVQVEGLGFRVYYNLSNRVFANKSGYDYYYIAFR